MPSFRFEAKDKSGVNTTGQLNASSEREAVRQLQAQGFFVMRINQQRSVEEKVAREPGIWRKVLEPAFMPVGSKALSLFFSSFAQMLTAGMTMHEAAETLAARAPARTLRRAAWEMAEMALRGQPITGVAKRYPAAFSPFVIALLDAGASSGMLDTAMKRIAEYYQSTHELESLARVESFYTKILIFALLIIPTIPTLVLGTFNQWLHIVIPRFSLVLGAFAVVWYGWRLLMRVSMLRRIVDRVKLCIPWVGSMVRRIAVAKWCSAMTMLYGAGVPVHTSLLAAGESSGNTAIAASIRRVADGALSGETLSSIMIASGDFPDMAIGMMVTGEKSGDVETSLTKVAEYYESEAQTSGKQGVMLATFMAYGVVMAIIAYFVISGWLNSDYVQGIRELTAPDAEFR